MKHSEGRIEIISNGDFVILESNNEGHIAKIQHWHNSRADFERIRDLWNAFDGISTHDALNIIQIGMSLKDNPGVLKYLEHGPEMVEVLRMHGVAPELLAKLEGGE